MEFAYTVTTNKGFIEAMAAVERELGKAGFRVLYTHDVQKTLSEKEFAIEPMNIIEFCNAKAAYAALQQDPQISLCMPCKAVVYVKGGATIITAMRPTILPQFFPNASLGDMPQEMEKNIQIALGKATA